MDKVSELILDDIIHNLECDIELLEMPTTEYVEKVNSEFDDISINLDSARAFRDGWILEDIKTAVHDLNKLKRRD